MNTGQDITINGVTLDGPAVPRQKELFTVEMLEFLAQLHREFAPRVAALDAPGYAQPPPRAGRPHCCLAGTGGAKLGRTSEHLRLSAPPPSQ